MYQEDLSLFSGDLLDSFQLFEELADYDHLKTDNLKLEDSTEELCPLNVDIQTLVSNLDSLEPNEDDDVTSWMEDRVNLLDILMDNEHQQLSDDDITAAMATFVDDVSPKLYTEESVDMLPILDTVFTSDVQQSSSFDQGNTIQISFTNSNDSGIELSIEEAGQDLLELLPQQRIENSEDPSSHSPLLGNLDNAVVNVQHVNASLLPPNGDNEDAADIITESSSLLDLFALGVHEVVPTISLSPVSSDMCYSNATSTSDVSLVIPPVSSTLSTVDLNQYFSLPSSPSHSLCSSPSPSSGRESPNISMGSSVCSSPGGSSPYDREAIFNTTPRVSSRSLKSTEGRIQDKKLRKMKQNKVAAIRYRIKKKVEGDTITEECEALQKRNDELRDQADTMSREIAYLKELFADVYKTKTAMKASKFTI